MSSFTRRCSLQGCTCSTRVRRSSTRWRSSRQTRKTTTADPEGDSWRTWWLGACFRRDRTHDRRRTTPSRALGAVRLQRRTAAHKTRDRPRVRDALRQRPCGVPRVDLRRKVFGAGIANAWYPKSYAGSDVVREGFVGVGANAGVNILSEFGSDADDRDEMSGRAHADSHGVFQVQS